MLIFLSSFLFSIIWRWRRNFHGRNHGHSSIGIWSHRHIRRWVLVRIHGGWRHVRWHWRIHIRRIVGRRLVIVGHHAGGSSSLIFFNSIIQIFFLFCSMCLPFSGLYVVSINLFLSLPFLPVWFVGVFGFVLALVAFLLLVWGVGIVFGIVLGLYDFVLAFTFFVV